MGCLRSGPVVQNDGLVCSQMGFDNLSQQQVSPKVQIGFFSKAFDIDSMLLCSLLELNWIRVVRIQASMFFKGSLVSDAFEARAT